MVDLVENARSDTMESLPSQCVYAMSPFVMRGYCVAKAGIFYRQTINHKWFLGHLKYMPWVQREGQNSQSI